MPGGIRWPVDNLVMHRVRLLWLIGLITLLSACAGYAPEARLAGQDRAAIVMRMGAPSLELPGADGGTLVYARGPYGRHTYFITLDSQGRALHWEQRLTENHFAQIRPGMGMPDVVALIGPSREVMALGRGRGAVWSFRYENPFCQWFRVEFNAEKIVRSSGYGEPPECEDRRRFRWWSW